MLAVSPPSRKLGTPPESSTPFGVSIRATTAHGSCCGVVHSVYGPPADTSCSPLPANVASPSARTYSVGAGASGLARSMNGTTCGCPM